MFPTEHLCLWCFNVIFLLTLLWSKRKNNHPNKAYSTSRETMFHSQYGPFVSPAPRFKPWKCCPGASMMASNLLTSSESRQIRDLVTSDKSILNHLQKIRKEKRQPPSQEYSLKRKTKETGRNHNHHLFQTWLWLQKLGYFQCPTILSGAHPSHL